MFARSLRSVICMGIAALLFVVLISSVGCCPPCSTQTCTVTPYQKDDGTWTCGAFKGNGATCSTNCYCKAVLTATSTACSCTKL